MWWVAVVLYFICCALFMSAMIWFVGAVAALAFMWARTWWNAEWDNYTAKEYIIGFFGSWYTIIVLSGFIDD